MIYNMHLYWQKADELGIEDKKLLQRKCYK